LPDTYVLEELTDIMIYIIAASFISGYLALCI